MSKTIITIIIIIIVAGLGYWIYQSTAAPKEEAISEGGKDCVNDDDCVVFGKTGDCNCGCFNRNNLPLGTGGECFSLAPTSCKCVNGKCEGIFEEKCGGMTLTEAVEIAKNSKCGDRLKDTYTCNEDTGTWWIDLDIEKEGCNPACVVNVETKEAEINWRCTGVID